MQAEPGGATARDEAVTAGAVREMEDATAGSRLTPTRAGAMHAHDGTGRVRSGACATTQVLTASVLASLLAPAMLGAQEGSACDGARVTAVEIRPEAPAIIDRSAPRWARPVLRVLLQSRTTDTSAIRPYVLLGAGESCSEFERAETERLLRAQPYLAEAKVRTVAEEGGVRAIVETQDDIPLIVGLSLDDGAPSRVLFGNANVLGLGMLASAEWERGYAYRDGFGAHFEHYHLLGGRRVAKLHAVRSPLSADYSASVARPYLTGAQRFAWSANYARSEGWLGFPNPGDDAVSLENARDLYGLAALWRIGGRNRRLLAGASLGHERGTRAEEGVLVTDSGFTDAGDTPFAERYQPFRTTSLAGILGTRLLAYTPVLGLDSLAGRQDVASGLQLMGTLGYDLGASREGGEDGREPFGILDLYVGRARTTWLTALAVAVEGQRAEDGWADVVANGRLAWYAKAGERRTHEASLEYMGAWQTRRPYRIVLSSRRGGVRGYAGSQAAGGRLMVLRLEERFAAGGFGRMVGFGAAAFTDLGKLWAGDVPYGETTSVRASLGTALLVAVPRRSQSSYRVEAAARLTKDQDADKWNLRIVRTAPYATFLREAGDLTRARRGRPSSALISSP
jgi:hypothetical protein